MDKTGEGLRAARSARGLTQAELARRAGISRQALGAIESGEYQPGVTVALRLARELGLSVERLFGSEPDVPYSRVDALWSERTPPRAGGASRVALGRVGGKLVALPQPAAQLSLTAPAGVVERRHGGQAVVATHRSSEEIDSSILMAGCDPAVSLLLNWLARRRSPTSAYSISCSSSSGLQMLLDGRVHVAGVHLKDPGGTGYNLAAASKALGQNKMVLINFARWEVGLATSPGNPHRIRDIADLGGGTLRVANRERGSGAREALDDALQAHGIPAASVRGYDTVFGGHLEVAAAVSDGRADIGVTLRVAASAYGLGFVPLREERYDLVFSHQAYQSEVMVPILDALHSSRFAREINQLCAYDTNDMGKLIARMN